ncbi:xylosyltransferase oxt [Dendroctonus ponderosae]|uniref:xylosyltransferase oxt n=1 Tax=Dendroctonus ponderosae TaxID=77166 RepID=UPI0020364FE0|nr:xylosyltransferase oxt [Dendroctonus ponderosae]
MVKTSPKSKYLRRYRTCFIIGIVILSLQLLLVANFLVQNKNTEGPENWEPSDIDKDSGSNSEALNSARRSDDEETNLLAPQTKRAGNGSIQLKVEDLSFELPCQMGEKQALSALNRAKSQRCKQLIANITCLALENQLYPTELRSSCPSEQFAAGKEMGCFKDEKNFRLLNGYFGVSKTDNSPIYCMNLCLQSGFPYAGVQYAQECFCGSDEPPSGSKLPDSSCNIKCPGDAHATCGGYYTMNVYQTGIKRFVPQTANETLQAVKQRKIAFLLTLNGRALRQVHRLLKLIYHRNHYYYIHVDVRQDYLYRELLALERFPNIRLTRKRFATIWGGASLLEMLRACMLQLLQMPDWSWDFILNLSESDFPVKPLGKLTQFLSANAQRNFVKSHGREVQRFIQKQGLDKTFVECEYRMWRVGNRKLPLGIQIDGGSDWVALSRPFVQYVANPEPDELVSGLLKVFQHTLLPAESFFHTVLRNSKFCHTYVDNNLHVTNWKRKLGCKCQYKHVVDWCGCSPNDFTLDDWAKVLNTQSRALYFARKFEPIVNQAVILQLELWLFNKDTPSKEVANLNSYWQNLFHHQDLGVAFDDSLMTLAESIGRRSLKALSNSSGSCDLFLSSLQQINSFHYNDHYKYSLLLLASGVEVAVKPINKLFVKPGPLVKHLATLLVSTEFDQKEQLSRNFLRNLSPYSDPVLVYKFSALKGAKLYNLTCLWVDPIGVLRDVSLFSLDANNLVGHVKAGMKQPHLPGVWKVKLLHKDSLLAQLSFPILPLQFLSGRPISSNEVSALHLSLGQSAGPIWPNSDYAKFLPMAAHQQTLLEKANRNAQRRNASLLAWIDSLVGVFYAIERVCTTADSPVGACGLKIAPCRTTQWSSLAPDPKSAIGDVNATTGMFDVW